MAGEASNDTVVHTFGAFDRNRLILRDFAAFDDLTDVLAATINKRGSAVITLAAGQTVTVLNVTKDQVFAGMFVFAEI